MSEVITPAIAEPRKELSQFAPQIQTVKINPEKIGLVIGPGGKTINKIVEDYKVQIDIEEDGSVFITGEQGSKTAEAVQLISDMTAEAEVGKTYSGTVIKIMDFGAFVEYLPGQEGLVHISQLADKRVEKVKDVVKEGDKVIVERAGKGTQEELVEEKQYTFDVEEEPKKQTIIKKEQIHFH